MYSLYVTAPRHFGVAMKFSFLFVVVLTTLFLQAQPISTGKLTMPWREAGLTDRQAAAHLLDRFTYGARPKDIDKVVAMGLENWFEEQLQANSNDAIVKSKIAGYKTLNMTTREIAEVYPTPGKVIIELMQQGKLKDLGDLKDSSNKEFRKTALKYAYENGYRPQRELLGQMIANKIIRAVYSENQLKEVMTDFWFNHFSVSMVKGQARTFIPTYERDAIRPNVLGNFRTLLEATAKHPAMLQYLDNAQSTAPIGTPTLLSIALDSINNMGGIKGWFARRKVNAAMERGEQMKEEFFKNTPEEFKPRRGINENYARELMELHTLGVNGGYTQKDVTEAARALTGWTMMPLGYNKRADKINDMIERGKKIGVVTEGDFLFRADVHDATEKNILGTTFKAGRGIDEGEQLLDMLTAHPSTAKRIALKLCTRFVSDEPPQTLVTKVADVFTSTKGDIPSMLRTIVSSPEFWNKEARRAKIKKPFEVAMSTLRLADADVTPTKELYDWITRLGEQLYNAQAPTGFPDNAKAWVNTGSLLNRMNFGLAVATNSIKGVTTNVQDLNRNTEPTTTEEALKSYLPILLPERDYTETVRMLTPVITSKEFGDKVRNQQPTRKQEMDMDDEILSEEELNSILQEKKSVDMPTKGAEKPQQQTLQNVVGIILGSPEFQRR